MKKVAVLIKDVDRQYEGLRSSLGLLLEAVEVQMFVLHHEIAALADKNGEFYETYSDNMEFLDEMEGERYSDNQENIEKYGFKPASMEEIRIMIREADLVIPF